MHFPNDTNQSEKYSKSHLHIHELMNHWGYLESVDLPNTNIFYKSEAMCITEGNKIKQFLENDKYGRSRSLSHTHWIGDKTTTLNASNITHTHGIRNAYRIRVRFKCVKGTVDY